jgi:nucleotide-binding universal stress UspA family protein
MMFRSVLAGVDGSLHALGAVRRAAEIAEADQATLTLITVYSSVVPWPLTMGPGVISQQAFEDIFDAKRQQAQAAMDAASVAVPGGVDLRTLKRGGWRL